MDIATPARTWTGAESMTSGPRGIRFLRVLLVLGRVSNLPTVWSNCLAAWLLAGGGSWGSFAALCVGATLFYTGGMFLNDAFDARFDRRYRPERPIASGQISHRAVWILGTAMLGLGWLVFLSLGRSTAAFASALLVAIVVYDAIHKRTALAPVLMSVCRFVLYLAAASVAKDGASVAVAWRALALAAYVAGLSYLARGESRPGAASRWPLGLLLAPIALVSLARATDTAYACMVAGLFGAWVVWCLRYGFWLDKGGFSRGVAGLLAGIALEDWLAAATGGQGKLPLFVGLFLLALILQRVAPAT